VKNHNEKTETTYWDFMSEGYEEGLLQENMDMIQDREERYERSLCWAGLNSFYSSFSYPLIAQRSPL